MKTNFLALPVLALVVTGLALCGTRNVSESKRFPAASERLVSRTMPPSPPKPDGPKKPRNSGTRAILPQGLA